MDRTGSLGSIFIMENTKLVDTIYLERRLQSRGKELANAVCDLFRRFDLFIDILAASDGKKDVEHAFNVVCNLFKRSVDTDYEKVLIDLIATRENKTDRFVLADIRLQIAPTANPYNMRSRASAFTLLRNALIATILDYSPNGEPSPIVHYTEIQPLFGQPINNGVDNVYHCVASALMNFPSTSSAVSCSVNLYHLLKTWLTQNLKIGEDDPIAEFNDNTIVVCGLPLDSLKYNKMAVTAITRAFGHITGIPDTNIPSRNTIRCVSSEHHDASPSMVLFLQRDFWKRSKSLVAKMSEEELKLVKEASADPARYDTRIASTDIEFYNTLDLKNLTILLYVVRGYCRSCNYSTILSCSQLCRAKQKNYI